MYRHGHYGVALLLSAPVTLLVGPTVGLGFSLVAVATSMLPDWDTHTARVRHRGPTHTLAFAVGVALALGSLAVVGWLAIRTAVPATNAPVLTAGAFVATGAFLGIISHLIADALTPGEGTNAMCPFWPASERTVRLGLVRVDSPTWNWGLLVAGVAAQVLSLLVGRGLS